MPFRKPVSTEGGLIWWKNIKQNEHFIMQKNKSIFWPYKYRILIRSNSKEIANANDLETITYDWDYLENNPVPRADEQGFLDVNAAIEKFIIKLTQSRI